LQALIKYNTSVIGIREIITAITDMGYVASSLPQSNRSEILKRREKKEKRRLRIRLIFAFVFAIPTFIISMVIDMFLSPSNSVRMIFNTEIYHGLTVKGLILFLLASFVQFWLGSVFYKSSFKSIRYTHSANMDVLIAVGTSASYFYSLYSLIWGMTHPDSDMPLFFETSVFLITFVFMGKYLEHLAKGKTSEAIKTLLELEPKTAILLHLVDHSLENVVKEEEIELALVQVGDILKINPGNQIPCDGIICLGSTSLDESMLTGESLPINKTIGDKVMAGTVNLSAMIYIKVTEVGDGNDISLYIQFTDIRFLSI